MLHLKQVDLNPFQPLDMNDFIIETFSLNKNYYQGRNLLKVLKGINLRVKKRAFTVIFGPSGAGKSTLIHILGGIERASSGRVLFNGKDINSLSEEELYYCRNRRIGFVFQFHHLLGGFTALENVALPCLIKGENKKQAFKKAYRLLEEVGLKDRTTHLPNQLSGGEQQKVAVTRALINEPDVLFADEPTGNLDKANGEMILSLLLDLKQKKDNTVVLVTHNEELTKKADEVIYIEDGRIKEPKGRFL